jgi:phage-related protein
MQYFRTEFLEEADRFIATLNEKAIKKIFYNIDLAQQTNDPKLFKKLEREIWEFRTKYNGLQIRLLAFWDKENKLDTIVFATHGFIKKVDKVPKGEIDRAVSIKENYFKNKKRKS